MKLSPERAGPYARALRVALEALAPNEDHVPLAAASRHLRALDPAVSGTLLAPAEVVDATGMPAYPWMERVEAEAAVLSRSEAPTEARIRHAERLDPDLGERMRARVSLQALFAEGDVLPTTRLQAAVKWMGEGTRWTLAYDHLVADGRWERIRAEVLAPGRGAGPLGISKDGQATVDERLQHVLTRHAGNRLSDLRDVLAEVTEAEVERLSRGVLGPFWFPGVVLPDAVPAGVGEGLLLHATVEVVSRDVTHSVHLDPWLPAPAKERVPEGYGVYRERRFAGKGTAYQAAREWAESAGMKNVVVPIGVRRRRL